MGSAMFQAIFQQPGAQSTSSQAREVVDLLEPKFPQVVTYLEAVTRWSIGVHRSPKAGVVEGLVNQPHTAVKLGGPSTYRRSWHLLKPGSHHLACRCGPWWTTQGLGRSKNATCHFQHSNKQNNSCVLLTNLEVTMVTTTS